ncbi:hypothetical protein ABZW11_05995 [Nonomuraea sp. NPDC004580]|uniref:hypothetical protein n=1 Tax=Nonomuraea sp. NPDC004580 TaxID=3154552 RepID=UPI0033A8F282
MAGALVLRAVDVPRAPHGLETRNLLFTVLGGAALLIGGGRLTVLIVNGPPPQPPAAPLEPGRTGHGPERPSKDGESRAGESTTATPGGPGVAVERFAICGYLTR